MAHKMITTLVDDIDGTEAAETVSFGLDGRSYEIDLSEKNAKALRASLGHWTARARTSGRPARTRQTVATAGASRNAEIRAWAHSNGRSVPARGRIPQGVVAAFDAAVKGGQAV
ncbi:Lsr2 protein [Humibacillus xanthopallidus]|uniref:Lsr2 protein n=1 Tax=Humibacillus xanthopallidus TaxID=412689 RepID=A0A543PR32_9MICO|nr:Lsr2 family protein [Humibacillus xanthopallidus]TQN46529.1 Lsr2 protein [Humibacillus xanthopallidus]